MRRRREATLVAGLIGVSAALTALTVWSVFQQGLALHQREWAALVGDAINAVTQRRAAVFADAQRSCDAAARFWQTGGAEELDLWAAAQRLWLLVIVDAGGHLTVLPSSPLSSPLPPSTAPATETQPLDYLRRLTASADPLTRAGALFATASREERVGNPLGAARLLADAATVLRSTPTLARYAFRAEAERVDSLLQAGDFDGALRALREFAAGLLMDPAGRLTMLEVKRLDAQARQLVVPASDPLAAALATLHTRAARRDAASAAAGAALGSADGATLAPDDLQFIECTTGEGEPLAIAVRGLGSEGARVALVAPRTDLLARYWRADEQATWRVAPRDSTPAANQLEPLPPPFSDLCLTPSAAAAGSLAEMARRRTTVVAAVAVATTGAWALVIWLVLRAMGQQHELVRLQQRFVADVSHELKTPLALIRLLSETLAEQRMADPERIQRYHETISREAERLSALIDNILDQGKIESGRKTYEFAACDLEAVARRAWTLFEPQWQRDGFEARLDVEPGLPTVRADASAIQQVLVNLLQNAHRYSRETKFVRLGLRREGRAVIIDVEDHGIGMSRAVLNQLGDTFFRAEDTRVRSTRGTGLGLAIVKHILDAHGAKLDVISRPGQGTKFSIVLSA